MKKWQEQDYFPSEEGGGGLHTFSSLPGLRQIGICRCFIMQKPLPRAVSIALSGSSSPGAGV